MTTLLPPQADAQALASFEAVVAQASPTDSIRDAFGMAIKALANGEAVRIEPIPELLTTSQAADMLGVSRTTMVKMLQDGKLPYSQPNVHRMVRLADVMEYQAELKKKQRDFLDQLTRETVADGSFFITAAEADAALKEVRRSKR